MSAPTIHGSYRSVSGSKLLSTLGESLQAIKEEDGLTDEDLGAELGKSDDQAAAYRKANAEMSATTLLRACKRWNGRFANAAFALIGLKVVPLDGAVVSDRRALTIVARSQAAIAENLEDEVMTDEELVEDRAAIEAAGAMYDGWRQRLAIIDGRTA
jgi:transcriptional regulator with XRE-family HTH domain